MTLKHRALILENTPRRAHLLETALTDSRPGAERWDVWMVVRATPGAVLDQLKADLLHDPSRQQVTIISYDVNFLPPDHAGDDVYNLAFAGLTVVLPAVRVLVPAFRGEALSTVYSHYLETRPRAKEFKRLLDTDPSLRSLPQFDPEEERDRLRFVQWADGLADSWEQELSRPRG